MNTEFSTEQFERIYPDGIERHWWHRARNRIVAEELARIGRPSAAVLDVGCGRGIAVEHLRGRGVDCRGVEPAVADPLPAVDEFIYRGIRAEDLPEATREGFEVLLLLDVIEHVPDPVDFLERLGETFANVRDVIVTVPACPELWTNYDEFNGHYRRYTPELVERTAEELGWTLSGRTYFFSLLYPPMRLLSRVGRDRSTEIKAPRGWRTPLHGILARLLVLENRVLPRGLRGSSIIAHFSLRDARGTTDG
jgi:SAM-dependent methyltransferase